MFERHPKPTPVPEEWKVSKNVASECESALPSSCDQSNKITEEGFICSATGLLCIASAKRCRPCPPD